MDNQQLKEMEELGLVERTVLSPPIAVVCEIKDFGRSSDSGGSIYVSSKERASAVHSTADPDPRGISG